MPKGLFIYIHDAEKSKNLGVFKKMYGQIASLQKEKVEVDFVYNSGRHLLFNGNTILYHNPGGLLKRLHEIFRFVTGYFKILTRKIDFTQYDFIYMRYSYFNYFLISFLKKIKQNYPGIQVFIEIPTYPYDKEFNTILHYPVLQSDKKYRNKIKGLVDRIVTYTNDDEIYGIPAIKVSNGIKADQSQIKSYFAQHRKFMGKEAYYAVAIAANISYWHAFDRAIKGLYNYYQTPGRVPVYLEIIGGGNEIENLKALVKELEMEKYIQFTDYVKEELELLLQKKDFSIGTLGMFRKNVLYDSSLKSREYCYHGLPFVLCTRDLCFDPDRPYWYYASNTDEPLKYDEILDWLIRLEGNHPDYKNEMHQYACEFLTWDTTFKNFIDYIKQVVP